jgi:hypothetical protein
MGCDLYSIEAPSDELRLDGDGADPLYFRFNWSGMGLMVATLAEADAVDTETPHPRWPDFPPRPDGWPHDEWDCDSEHPLVTEYNAALDGIRSTPGVDNKPPGWKFASNDGWVITPEECTSIHTALATLTRLAVRRVLERRADDQRFMDAAWRAEDELASVSKRNPELAALVEEVLTAATAVEGACATETHIRVLAGFNRLREQGLCESDDDAIDTFIALLPVLLGLAEADASAVTEDDVTECLQMCEHFARYCWRCQYLGGFEVW